MIYRDKIEKACKENCSFKRKCIYYENPDDEIAKIKVGLFTSKFYI